MLVLAILGQKIPGGREAIVHARGQLPVGILPHAQCYCLGCAVDGFATAVVFDSHQQLAITGDTSEHVKVPLGDLNLSIVDLRRCRVVRLTRGLIRGIGLS